MAQTGIQRSQSSNESSDRDSGRQKYEGLARTASQGSMGSDSGEPKLYIGAEEPVGKGKEDMVALWELESGEKAIIAVRNKPFYLEKRSSNSKQSKSSRDDPS